MACVRTPTRGKARLLTSVILVATIAATLVGCGSSATQAPTAAPATAAPATAAPSEAATAAPATAAPTASAAAGAVKGGTLIMARQQEPTTLDPIVSDNNGSLFITQNMFEGLYETVPGTLEPAPALAESYEISADGLSYTFHLRQAKFSNGDPITADDVKFSLDRSFNPDTDPVMGFLFETVASVTAVDPSTVKVTTKVVDPAFLSKLTVPNAVIVPMKAVQADATAFAENPVSSGPFMLKSWTRGQSLELVRNPNYWRTDQPYLDAITFNLVADDNARILRVQSGEAQLGDNIPLSQVSRLDGVQGLKVLKEPSMSIWQVLLNNSLKPLDDIKVRQALNYATPKDVINKLILGDTGTIANSQIPRLRFWDANIKPYAYDIEKAKQLIAESSVPGGFTLPLVMQSGDTMLTQLATILQQEWAKIGVKVDIQSVDRPTRLKRASEGDYGALIRPSTAQSSDITDDSEYAAIYFDTATDWKGNNSRYKNDQANQLQKEAGTTVDPAKRQQLYSQLQQVTMDDPCCVPMVYAQQLTVVSDKVQGFSTLPTGWWLLREVWLSQ
jgi:peptide/nickel transport system substrate-binding protein